jgi:hypothetical protein
MTLEEIKIIPHSIIPSGEVWCAYDAYEHIKKILKLDGAVKLPTIEEIEKELEKE